MDNQLHAGSAEVVITPPLGVSMAGYYEDRRADDVLDDLYAKALVISTKETIAALVVCDLIGLERAITSRLREMIEVRTQIPAAHVMICCTHTHTGPMTSAWPSTGVYPDEAYMDVLVHKIADAVQLAFQRRRSASARVAHGRVEGIAFNRRCWMKDGTLRTNPSFQNPDVGRPAGPIDPDLGLFLLRDDCGAPLALVSNYAIHPDQVGGTAVCADHEGVVSSIIKQVLGARCSVLCPNGCCGDINHYDLSKPLEGQSGFATAQRSGRALAGEAIRRLSDGQPVQAGLLRAGSRTFQARLRVPSSEEVAWAEKKAQEEVRAFDAHGLEVVKAHRILEIHASAVSHVPVEISAIAVGDVAFVGLPGEIFVELGLGIKQQSPFAYTFVAELCNDAAGYVPTRRAYDEGGYEVASTLFEPGTGEQMVEAALELLDDLRSGI